MDNLHGALIAYEMRICNEVPSNREKTFKVGTKKKEFF